jgi:hypothetical protein
MKKHPHYKKKKHKGTNRTQIASTPNGDKGEKHKNKKNDRHFNFCDKYGHDESKCFKNMTTLEETMKNHNISIDSTYSSSSHGHAFYASSFLFNTTSTSSDEWLIDSRSSYHMAKDKDIFSSLSECNTKKIFFGDDRSLSVVGSGTVQVDNGHFNDVLCVPSLSYNY